MSAARHPVDDLRGWRLRLAAAHAYGCTDYFTFDPWTLFIEAADVMERWGPIYEVHVRMPKKVLGLTSWMSGRGTDPLDACLRAVIKRREAVSGDAWACRSALHLMTDSSNVGGS